MATKRPATPKEQEAMDRAMKEMEALQIALAQQQHEPKTINLKALQEDAVDALLIEENAAVEVPSAAQVGGTHYTDMTVQPWEVMQAILSRSEFIGYLKGNIIKYSMRQGKKDSDDAGKCRHYMDKLREVLNA